MLKPIFDMEPSYKFISSNGCAYKFYFNKRLWAYVYVDHPTLGTSSICISKFRAALSVIQNEWLWGKTYENHVVMTEELRLHLLRFIKLPAFM